MHQEVITRCEYYYKNGKRCQKDTSFPRYCDKHLPEMEGVFIKNSKITIDGESIGLGLFAATNLCRGKTFEYKGRVIKASPKNGGGDYALTISKNEYIDANESNSCLARYANDCRPQNVGCKNNAILVRKPKKRYVLELTEDVAEGVEICTQYGPKKYWKEKERSEKERDEKKNDASDNDDDDEEKEKPRAGNTARKTISKVKPDFKLRTRESLKPINGVYYSKASVIGKGIVVKQSTNPCAEDGLFATKKFVKNDIITEYDGEVITQEEAKQYKLEDQTHFMSLRNGFVVAGYRAPDKGIGGAQFANASDGPVCPEDNDDVVYKANAKIVITHKLIPTGRPRTGIPNISRAWLKATQDIDIGDEIMFPYEKTYWTRRGYVIKKRK